MGTLSGEATHLFSILPPISFAPLGVDTYFERAALCMKANMKSQKMFPCVKMAEIHSIPIHLNNISSQ